jgi:hypothetical protein
MNEKIKNGGPGFPLMGMDYRNGQQVQAVFQNGMSLRDFFAAKAMQGFCAHGGSGPITQQALAEFAYQLADAMLAERERGE